MCNNFYFTIILRNFLYASVVNFLTNLANSMCLFKKQRNFGIKTEQPTVKTLISGLKSVDGYVE